MASRLFVVLLVSTMVLCAVADDVRSIRNARKLLRVNAAGKRWPTTGPPAFLVHAFGSIN
jgi:hypothetical protein